MPFLWHCQHGVLLVEQKLAVARAVAVESTMLRKVQNNQCNTECANLCFTLGLLWYGTCLHCAHTKPGGCRSSLCSCLLVQSWGHLGFSAGSSCTWMQRNFLILHLLFSKVHKNLCEESRKRHRVFNWDVLVEWLLCRKQTERGVHRHQPRRCVISWDHEFLLYLDKLPCNFLSLDVPTCK